MRLRRLELQGFKSFLDRTILSFDPGVTGVVGPNGCGKSNIVDAILWVMGEQSPKHLRGESMTDVIFNGSDSRAPTSMAEVSLVLDREGVALAPQFSAFAQGEEITITRRIYRDGAGEYLINKSICRLKDIHELFMDTGVGRRAYSIIEQGQIDRMINVKPEDRRYLFEEVAGITKYKTKRKEAEKKLEATNLNLSRLQDIIVELEKQIRSLKIQATKARKYREIKQELEVADLFVLGRSLFNKKNLLEALDKEKNERVNEKSELDAKISQVDAEVTELDIRRIDEEKQYQNLSQRERELAVSLQKLEGQLEVLAERQKFLLQNKENLETELSTLTTNLEETQTEKDQLKSASEELETQLQEKLNEVKLQESTFETLQSEKRRKTESKNSFEVELSSLNKKEIQCRSLSEHLSSKSIEMTEQLENLSQERAELTTAELQTKSGVHEIEQKIEACLLKSKEAEAISAEVHADCQKLSSELSLKEEELFRTREEYQGKRSRLESLKELQENLEGYSPTAREILLKLPENALTAAPLADCFQPDPELEDCLELLLGNEMNTLVVSTQEEAENLVRLIEEKQLERVRVVSSGSVALEIDPGFPGLIPVTQKLRVKPGFENLVRHWLGSVFICESEAQVFELAKQHSKHTFICLSSRVVAHGDTSFSCGIPQVTVGVFARKREIEELHSACDALSAKVTTLTDLRAALLSELESQEAKEESLKSELSKIHVEHVEFRKEKERFLGDLNRLQKELSQSVATYDRLQRQIEDLEAQKESLTLELSELGERKQSNQTELDAISQEILAMDQKVQSALSVIQEKKVETSQLEERRRSLSQNYRRLEQEVEDLEMKLASCEQQKIKEEEEQSKIDNEKVTTSAHRESVSEDRNQVMVRVSDVKESFDKVCMTLQDLRAQKEDLSKTREESLERIQELELKLTTEKAQFEQQKSIAMERYQKEPESISSDTSLTMEQLPLLASEITVTWDLLLANEKEALLEEHVKSLRQKIERYGEVNLTAIHEFDEVQKRFDFLTMQKNDLEKSIEILQQAIVKIDETTKTRFQETFEAVNKKFKEIFPVLFNGGKAELALTNSENMLEAGVDVLAQPPGKRLQSISLLSGGEKALTAVSLVLSIFARKPSPFCLLDEVDAPLDDANVSRFNTVISKMAEKTQFIVITHNKKTMEIAEALYGVTMERAGVSKMTSVRMN